MNCFFDKRLLGMLFLQRTMLVYSVLVVLLLSLSGCSVHRLRKNMRRNGEAIIVTVYDSSVMNDTAADALTEFDIVPDFDAAAFGKFIALHGSHRLPACDSSGSVTVKEDNGDVQVVRFSIPDRCVVFEIVRPNGETKIVKKRLKKRALEPLTNALADQPNQTAQQARRVDAD